MQPARCRRAWPTVVVPAYNEAGRIETVLQVLRQVENLTEILVVDDGSQDDTVGVTRRQMGRDARLRLIQIHPNGGKGAAMVAGAEAAATDLVVFLDADLIGLCPEHIGALVRPVAAGQCDMNVAVFRQGRLYTDLSHILTPDVSGERCLRWSDFRDAAGLREARYGAEMILEHHARACHLRRRHVVWRGVTHVTKEEKQGFWRGLVGRGRADWQMLVWLCHGWRARWEGRARTRSRRDQDVRHTI